MWDYKSARLNFRVATTPDGDIAERGDTIKGSVNAKIDGVPSELTTTQASTLADIFYTTLAAASHYDTLVKTVVLNDG